MTVQVIGSFPLSGINLGLNDTVAAVGPLLAQVDLSLTGPFGLGAASTDISEQLTAALSTTADLSLTVSNPAASIAEQTAAIEQILQSLAVSAAFDLPAISADVTSSLGAAAAIAATLGAQSQGIQSLIAETTNVKNPLANLSAQFAEVLSVGPFPLLSVGYDAPTTLAAAAADFASLAAAGFGGLLPSSTVYGVIFLTDSPSAAAALSSIIRTA